MGELTVSGEDLILDIHYDEEGQYELWYGEEDGDEEGDESSLLAAMAPLRDDVLGGDLRLFYLLWLQAVDVEDIGPDEREPLAGIAQMTGALEAFAKFLGIDADLVAAAAGRNYGTVSTAVMPPDAVRRIVGGLADEERVELLARLTEADPHVRSELRSHVRRSLAAGISTAVPETVRRTAGELIARAAEIRRERERNAEERKSAEQRRKAEDEARAHRVQVDALAKRGEAVWHEVETEIMRRNRQGYDNAAGLLADLSAFAEQNGTAAAFVDA